MHVFLLAESVFFSLCFAAADGWQLSSRSHAFPLKGTVGVCVGVMSLPRRAPKRSRNTRTIGLIVSDASFHFHSSSANNHPPASSSGGALHQQVLYCLRRQKAHTSTERAARCAASCGVRSGTGLLFVQPGLYLGRTASLGGQPHAILIKVISLQCSNQGLWRRNANARVRESGTSQRGGSQRRGKRWWDASSGGLEEDGSWSLGPSSYWDGSSGALWSALASSADGPRWRVVELKILGSASAAAPYLNICLDLINLRVRSLKPTEAS